MSSVDIFSTTYFADEYLVSNLQCIYANESVYIITPSQSDVNMQKQSKSYSTELKVGTKIIDSSNTYQRIVSNAISRKNSTILASKANIGKVICKFCEQLFASSTNHTTNACNKYIINNPLKFPYICL